MSEIIHTCHGFAHEEPSYNTPVNWWAARHTDLIVAVSGSLRELLAKKVQVPRHSIVRTLVNGIDVQRFSPGPRSGALRLRFRIRLAHRSSDAWRDLIP